MGFEALLSKVFSSLFARLRSLLGAGDREDEFRLLNRIYQTQSRTSQLILRCKTEQELYEGVCRIAVEYGGMKLAWIGIEDPETRRILPAAQFGEPKDYLDSRTISSRGDIPEGKGPTGCAIRENRPSFIHNFKTDPRTAVIRKGTPTLPWGSSGSIPVRRNRKAYAALSFYDTVVQAFSDQVVVLLQEIAADMEFALTRFEMERRQREAEEALRIAAIAFESQEGLIVCDIEGRILRTNESISRMTGYGPGELVGKDPRMLQSDRHSEDFYAAMWSTLHRTGSWEGEVWCRARSGDVFPSWMILSIVRNADGAPTHFIQGLTDITMRKQAEEQISRLAYYDALTGLPNRQLLGDRFSRALAVNTRAGGYGAVLFLDLDNFKNINDMLGHQEGDKLLREMARRLRGCTREEDTVARFGGDEFVVLLENLGGDRDGAALTAKRTADRLLEVISEPFVLRDTSFSCSASIGVALWRGSPKLDIHEILKHSDVAMYEAKKAGRSGVCFFDPGMQTALERRTRVESSLRQALSRKEFLLYFQKRVDSEGQTLGAEVLLRWLDPARGVVGPGEFIAVAEESGLIVPIGRWILERACLQLKDWAGSSQTRNLRLSVNISPKQFAEERFVEEVQEILSMTGANPARLELEITENLLVQDVAQIIPKMEALRSLGIAFAIDDFGTGYSSLAYLQRLPINVLKIDQSFVRDMPLNRSSEAIVRTIIQMGHSLGLEVIAEGVETDEQRAMLTQRGCGNFQGYLFGRPVPIEAFERDLAPLSAVQ
jgi:diguanylate cyclase (GGDEF)-like protein/PAS domain S-box-containing protein